MKKKDKLETIARAFRGVDTVTNKELAQRLAICGTCPHNSDNVEGKTPLQSLRSAIIEKPFCTACGCQVFEKATQANEECGLAELGQEPLWPRLVAETAGADLNLRNLSTDKVKVSVDDDYYLVELGEIERLVPVNFQLSLEHDSAFNIVRTTASCPGCTKVGFRKTDDSSYLMSIVFTPTKNMKQKFIKGVYVDYTTPIKGKRILIKLKGTIK